MFWKSVVLMCFLLTAAKAVDDLDSNHTVQDQKNLLWKKHLALDWLKSVGDSFWNLLAVTKHPNFGGVQLLNPQNLWEKLHKEDHPLTGPSAAVFGAAHNGPSDYPFAYRSSKK